MYSFTEVQLCSSSAGCFFACIPLVPPKNRHSWGTGFLEKTTQATLIPYISLFYYTPLGYLISSYIGIQRSYCSFLIADIKKPSA
jgi:hypothetical protein